MHTAYRFDVRATCKHKSTPLNRSDVSAGYRKSNKYHSSRQTETADRTFLEQMQSIATSSSSSFARE